MTRNVTITLAENSTAGNPPKFFADQDIDITHESDTVITGVDGKTSVARHPSEILWRGGKVKELNNITHVKIVADSGAVLIDGELNIFYEVPRDVAGGVKFFVLKGP
jgi:hypothetical protein